MDEKVTNDANELLPDRIAATFRNKNVLITGSTGFLGKVFLEKLLRMATDIGKIYLLVRPKKGKDTKERIISIFNNPLFDLVRKQRGLEKLTEVVQIIDGDMMHPTLNLSDFDREIIIDNVNIIVHIAATIRFDESLKTAVLLNTRGTKLMLQLAKECKHLELFEHISTAYCHSYIKHLFEDIYDSPADPHQIIRFVETADDKTIDSITPKLLAKLPNTYAFSKALAEGLINEEINRMPIQLIRPSVVIPIFKEPLPGWTDNINGPTGLLLGGGKGVIRSGYCDKDTYVDYIPVDIAANAMMIAAWNFISRKDTTLRVANLTTSAELKVTWDELIQVGMKIIKEQLPLNYVLWYPGVLMTRSRYLHKTVVVLFQIMPALILDFFLKIGGYEPILLKIQRRIAKGLEVLEYYGEHQWDFCSKNGQAIRKLMNERERKLYKVDAEDVDLEQYMLDCTKCARLFILKESDETIPAAKRHIQIHLDRLYNSKLSLKEERLIDDLMDKTKALAQNKVELKKSHKKWNKNSP